MTRKNGDQPSKNRQPNSRPAPQPASRPQPTPARAEPGGLDAKHIKTLVDADLRQKIPDEAFDLLSRDFPLSNIDRNDREYFRLLSDNVELYLKERFPPEESVVQGDVGAALLEDPEYDKVALTQEQRNALETSLMTMYARTGRAVGGWQQDKMTESISTRRVETLDEESDGGDKGLLGRIFS